MELELVQPLTAKWLTKHGYTYRREVKMPEYGRADFVAKDSNDKILVVECKSKLDHRTRSYIMQLFGYCHQFDKNVLGALAAPKDEISDFARNLCAHYDVSLIPITIEENLFAINKQNFLSDLTISYLHNEVHPLPFIIANKCHFRLAFIQIDGKIYYSIQDWIKGLTDANPRTLWADIGRRNDLKSNMIIKKLPYTASNNKTYQMDFTDDTGLYMIVQYLRITKKRPLLDELKRFLAEAGAFVDLVRREPENAVNLIGHQAQETARFLDIDLATGKPLLTHG
jgi:hypothetical protein